MLKVGWSLMQLLIPNWFTSPATITKGSLYFALTLEISSLTIEPASSAFLAEGKEEEEEEKDFFGGKGKVSRKYKDVKEKRDLGNTERKYIY